MSNFTDARIGKIERENSLNSSVGKPSLKMCFIKRNNESLASCISEVNKRTGLNITSTNFRKYYYSKTLSKGKVIFYPRGLKITSFIEKLLRKNYVSN